MQLGDTLKDAGITLVGLALLTGLVRGRMEHSAVRMVRRSVHGGTLRAEVRAPLFEDLSGSVKSLRITGSGLTVDDLPLRIRDGSGPVATARHVDLDFRDVTLRGLPIRRFQAHIPAVRFSAWDALVGSGARIRSAREGTARVEVGTEALTAFAVRKFPALINARVSLREGRAGISATVPLFGVPTPVETDGTLGTAEGRYVTYTPTSLKLNGSAVAPELAGTLVTSLNPVLDLQSDLGVSGWATLQRVELLEGAVVLHATVRIPAQRPIDEGRTGGGR